MPNRTISLDEVSDAIRKQLVKDGENFSHWVRMQLRKYSPGESEPKVKPAPPRNYMCKNCFGNHWTADCPTLEASEWVVDGMAPNINAWLANAQTIQNMFGTTCIVYAVQSGRYAENVTRWWEASVMCVKCESCDQTYFCKHNQRLTTGEVVRCEYNFLWVQTCMLCQEITR